MSSTWTATATAARPVVPAYVGAPVTGSGCTSNGMAGGRASQPVGGALGTVGARVIATPSTTTTATKSTRTFDPPGPPF